MRIQKLLMATAVATALGTASVAQAGIINFDRNGLIGGVASNAQFTSFDWNFGNILFDNLFPVASSPDASATTVLGAAKLSALQPNGEAPLAGTEITYVFTAPSLATLVSDGHAILSGHFVSGGGVLTVGSTNVGGLDQGPDADQDGGVTTVSVNGSISYDLVIDSYDKNFFLGNIDVLDPTKIDFSFTTDTSDPFKNANPSDAVNGVTPNFGNGVNDAVCGTTAGNRVCDLQVESDARLPLTAIPEPTSLALVGAGLLGFAARRRKQA
ncbi:MAG: PEP-CTERM sorting domain-containing protein [Gammaproteobacteria bacterium]|nr:PEP-CTERM sorting domain-containing protein [Gammaproteobacteria bacterium]